MLDADGAPDEEPQSGVKVATRTSTSRGTVPHAGSGPIVVGVDPTGRSTSAVLWAAEEAERTDRPLQLVSVYPSESEAADHAPMRSDLAGVARRLTFSDMAYEVRFGSPTDVLLDAAADGCLLVVSRRADSGIQRRLLGSTSMTVAGRSLVPVVVAPEPWLQPSMASSPVVVGVETRRFLPDTQARRAADADREVLDFAFERADQLRVPLIVVHAFEIPGLTGWSVQDVAACRHRYEEMLQERLQPWRDTYPDVEVAPRCVPETPRQALLDAARVAQLTVLGRHSGGQLRGTQLGSTTRAFLFRAEQPVAVVPTPAARIDIEEAEDAGA